MNKYRDESDFEINKAVAIARGAEPFHNDGFKKSTGYFHKDAVIIKAKFKIGAFDPCNNPADSMPIIIENGISSLFNGDEWICSALDGEFLSINENLYRAAMEVFMMMKEAENEKV